MNFNDFCKLYEASLKGNPGIPGEGEDKNEPKYLADVEAKGKQLTRTNGVRFPQSFGELMPLVQKSSRLMSGKEKELEALATELILSEYGSIIEGVANLKIELVKPGSLSFDEAKLKQNKEKKEKKKEEPKKKGISFKNLFKEEEKEEPKKEESTDRESIISDETHKRKIANNIIQGEAKNTKHIIHSDLCKDGLIKIFGDRVGKELHSIFDRITKIMDGMDWAVPQEVQADMWNNAPEGFAGKVKVTWDKEPENSNEEEREEEEEESIDSEGNINKEKAAESVQGGKATIHAQGCDFPMLIHEAVKGIYELIASAGQYKDADIAQEVAVEADDLLNEMEDLRYGPIIAADLRDFVSQYPNIDKYPNLREHFFGRMIQLDSKDFLGLMKSILMKLPSARRKVDSMLDEIISELDNWELNQHIDLNGEEDEHEEHEIAQEETKEEEFDYSRLSKKQLQDEIDTAIDDGDFDRVHMLSKFLKESIKYKK